MGRRYLSHHPSCLFTFYEHRQFLRSFFYVLLYLLVELIGFKTLLSVGREIIHSVGDVFLHYGFVERMQIVRKIASDRVFLSQSLVLYGCDEHHAVRISRDGVLSSVCHARCIGGEIPWSERSAKP